MERIKGLIIFIIGIIIFIVFDGISQRSPSSSFNFTKSDILTKPFLIIYNTPMLDTLKIKSQWSKDTDILALSTEIYDTAGIKELILYQNFTAINLLALLDEYAEECYNDSTENSGYVPAENSFDGIYYIYTPTTWIHREPTLKDFREFLRKKINDK